MRRFLCYFVLAAVISSAAWAQSYDIKVMTPSVQSAIDGRKARFTKLKIWKAEGVIGETNRAYLQDFGGDVVLKELVAAENKDRRTIYAAIVEQNNLGSRALETVEKAFAAVQRERASSGERIQDESGTWRVK